MPDNGNEQPEPHDPGHEETGQTDQGDAVPSRWNIGQDNQGRTDDLGGKDNGKGNAVGNTIQATAQGLQTAMFKLKSHPTFPELPEDGAKLFGKFTDKQEIFGTCLPCLLRQPAGMQTTKLDFAHKRPGKGNQLQVRIELEAHSFNRAECLEHQIQIRPQGQFMAADEIKQVLKNLAGGKFPQGPVKVLIHHIPEITRQIITIHLSMMKR